MAEFALWARMTTQRFWRGWLTRHLSGRWLANDRFRHLRFEDNGDQNPEYRIAEDARVATDAPINMAAGLLSAVFTVVVFVGVLWNVGGDLVVDVFGHSLTVPKYLVITVTVYSALLTLGMIIIGRNLTSTIAGKNAAEAQFRSVASNLRERGVPGRPEWNEPSQHRALDRALDGLIVRWRALLGQLMRTTLISQGNILAAPVVAWVLCAPKYLGGTMSLGEVAQAVAAFVMVQTAMNWLVDNYPGLSECMSSVDRVASLLVALDELDAQGSDVPLGGVKLNEVPVKAIKDNDVPVDNAPLIRLVR